MAKKWNPITQTLEEVNDNDVQEQSKPIVAETPTETSTQEIHGYENENEPIEPASASTKPEAEPVAEAQPALIETVKADPDATATEEDDFKAKLREEYGGALDDILNDKEAYAQYKPILKGQYQDYVDSKKDVPNDKQRKRQELYNVINKGVSALSQLGTAIGLSKTATTGPVGGALEPHDYVTPIDEKQEKDKKAYDDARQKMRDARAKLDKSTAEMTAYAYKNKKEREALRRQKEKEDRDFRFKESEAEKKYNEWKADNDRKNRESDAKIDAWKQQAAASIAKKEEALIKAGKTKAERNAIIKGQYEVIPYDFDENGSHQKEIWIDKRKMNIETVQQVYESIDPELRKEFLENYYNLKLTKPNTGGFKLGTGKDVDINGDWATIDVMKQAIGYAINKKGGEMALKKLISLTENNKVDIEDMSDGVDESKVFK